MRVSWLVLVLSAVCVAVHAATSLHTPIPLWMWGGSSALDVRSGGDIRTLADVGQRLSLLSDMVVHPQVVVSFIYPKATSAEVARTLRTYSSSSNPTALEREVEQSVFSVSVPYLAVEDESVSAALSMAIARSSSDVVTLKVKDACNGIKACHQSCGSQLSALQTDGPLQHVQVTLSLDTVSSDRCMESVMTEVKKRVTDGRYVAVASFEGSATTLHGDFNANANAAMSLLEFQTQAIPVVRNTTYPNVVYISPNILWGLLVSALLLLMLFSGVCAIMSIQTPLRFPYKKLPVNKEY